MIPQAPWMLSGGFPILLNVGRFAGSGTRLVERDTGAEVVRRRTEREIPVR